jgi:probable F420-dependent oxidoreductase
VDVGVIFPQTEMGSDPGAVREYARAAEELGYAHVFVADHVLGADPSAHGELARTGFSYSHKSVVHEPLTLLAFIAAVTTRLNLCTGILILPQRETALVAKQAAELDVLSGGRLRLGIGVGWNYVEYEALTQDFHNRGRRCDEQIALLRALWTQETVDFHGRWHDVTHAGINPLPVQRPIPVWIGGYAEAVLRRIGQIADGWFPLMGPDAGGLEAVALMREYAREAGRDPASIGVEGRVRLSEHPNPEDWQGVADIWAEAGASHLSINTMGAGLKGPDEHIDAIRRFKEAVSA